ncbi:unnamed protein product [Mytilus coruscus]|uniref:PHD-type domain-containing protein n=1 Tax=Mytilus coruscus TaxID=42192 RepID=A0A6J8EWQ6_MYTCO|nr:unnamed protein product [Mytilus coruscus]
MTNPPISYVPQRPEKEDDELCPNCEKAVQTEGIACDNCNNWYHYECVGLTEDNINSFQKLEFPCDQRNDDLLYLGATNISQPKENDQETENNTSGSIQWSSKKLHYRKRKNGKNNTSGTKSTNIQRKTKIKYIDSEQDQTLITQRTRILDLENKVNQLRTLLQTFKEHIKTKVMQLTTTLHSNIPTSLDLLILRIKLLKT